MFMTAHSLDLGQRGSEDAMWTKVAEANYIYYHSAYLTGDWLTGYFTMKYRPVRLQPNKTFGIVISTTVTTMIRMQFNSVLYSFLCWLTQQSAAKYKISIYAENITNKQMN